MVKTQDPGPKERTSSGSTVDTQDGAKSSAHSPMTTQETGETLHSTNQDVLQKEEEAGKNIYSTCTNKKLSFAIHSQCAKSYT